LVRQVLGGDAPVAEAEISFTRPGGSPQPRTYTVRIVPVPQREYQPQVWLIATDVTERGDLEAQLFHAQRVEAIGHLSFGLVHAFNNLLTIIRGWTSLSLEALAPNDPGKYELAQVNHSVEQARKLVKRLLNFARRQPIEPRLVDPNQVVLQVIACPPAPARKAYPYQDRAPPGAGVSNGRPRADRTGAAEPVRECP
jgi:signal transduction histidine kinase